MHVIIFGASGKIGSRLVQEMLKRNHDVTAFVFGPNPFKNTPRLTTIQGDVHKAQDVHAALEGQDMVLSALGSWGTKSKDILSAAMANIVPAMESHGITRIVSLTGADARDPDDKPNLLQRLSHQTIRLLAGPIVRDGEQHMRTLRASALDWTVLRSPIMTNRGTHGRFRLSTKLPLPWHTIHRQDVVEAMAELIASNKFVRQSPVIYRR